MATINDVARWAGVSTTTVSHVVNHTRYVSPELVARVQEAVKALNYQPNALARGLRGKQIRALGMVIPDNSNPFFAEISRHIEDAAFEKGYNIILCNSDRDPAKEQRYIELLLEKQVAGIIFVSAGGHVEHLNPVFERHLPLVEVDRELGELFCDRVLVDNYAGGQQVTRHLLERGHARIACIAGPRGLSPIRDRLRGYSDALGSAAVPFDERLVLNSDLRPQGGYDAMQQLLDEEERPTAVFVFNDLMAIGAMRAAGERGLRIPQDLAVVGFDDIALASFTNPPLTTVAQPFQEMGRLAAELLLERIAGSDRPPVRYMLEARLVIRRSS